MPDRKSRIPYDRDQMLAQAPHRVYSGAALREIAFPLGGIGTGCISLGGRGQLRDWEIFNRPNQGFRPQFTFATLRMENGDGEAICKVVESPPLPPYSSTHGGGHEHGGGLPHLEGAIFRGEYPLAWVDFRDTSLSIQIHLEAFNPFIPLEPDQSSLPLALLSYRLTNGSEHPVRGMLCWTVQNVVGYGGSGRLQTGELGGNRNQFRSEDGLSGFFMTSERYAADSPRHGSLALATTWQDLTWSPDIGRGGDFDTGHVFWDRISERGRFNCEAQTEATPEGRTAVCALGMRFELPPGQYADLPVLIGWHFPNFVKYWHQAEGEEPPQWKNYYAHRFADAWEVVRYAAEHGDELREGTRRYHDALFGSTLPSCVLDAASSQTSTLKSPTCLRLEDGTFYGFEGCGDTWGCCVGSCTHVWNYQQALPFLFPSLERSMRSTDYQYNLREEDGKMCFRLALPRGSTSWDYHAAADGQLGGVMKTYRDWLICGDDDWLGELWPAVQKALAYAWEQWDEDRDGLPEGVQHNTYDIELHGPNPLIGCFYLGALRAAEQMALHFGEEEKAARYRHLHECGAEKMDQHLFNGDYFVQHYDPEEAPRNQFGDGCLADQMLGQWIASICDLGYLAPPEHVRGALRSVFRYNWRASLSSHPNPQRLYALDGEAGLLMCTWPRGGRPLIPTRYCDEVWTGIEYQAASHLITEGFVEEGVAIVKGARDRYDGRKRNPWDEFECGSHYARAMSSWGLVLALSGYHCRMPEKLLRFDPRLCADQFNCFWSNAAAWGTYEQELSDRRARIKLGVLHGRQELSTLQLGLEAEDSAAAEARIDGRQVECSLSGEQWTEVRFEPPVTVRAGETLQVDISV